jgi:hypothetical protein
MAISGQSLADGQLPAAKGTLFTATSITYEKTITFFNTSAVTTETIVLYMNRLATGVSRGLRQIVLPPRHSEDYTNAIPMSIGDILEGETTNAATVDYTIGGGITS